MSSPRILVAGVGNIFLGDDGFGSEVARRLAAKTLPAGVRVKDFGIRGMDLAYELTENHDLVIFIDAVSRGSEPGTLYVIEPPCDASENSDPHNAHGMTLPQVMQFGRSHGAELKNVRIVGCEPATFGDELEGAMGLSDIVSSAIDPAVQLIEKMIAEMVPKVVSYA